MLTAGADRTARLWDAATGSQQWEFRHDPTGEVWSVAFSPDGKLALTASENRSAQLWDIANGRPYSAPFWHEDRVNSVAFSPKGNQVLTGSFDGTARIWPVPPAVADSPPLNQKVVALAWSPDGSRVLAASNHQIRVWKTPEMREVGSFDMHNARDATFGPTGQMIIVADGTETWFYESKPSQFRPVSRLSHLEGLKAMAMSPDGCLIAYGCQDSTLHICDAATGNPVGSPRSPKPGSSSEAYVSAVTFSPDSKFILAAYRDRAARLWAIADDAAPVRTFDHPGVVLAANFSSDGRYAVTSATDKTALIWEVATGQPLGVPLEHPGDVYSAVFSPDATTVITGCQDGKVRRWDVQTGQLCGPALIHGAPARVAVNPKDATQVISVGEDGIVCLWTLPPALTGNADQVRDWVEDRTCRAMDAAGNLQRLSFDDWLVRRQRVAKSVNVLSARVQLQVKRL